MIRSVDKAPLAAPGFGDAASDLSPALTEARTGIASPVEVKNARRLRSGRLFSLAFGAALVALVGSSVMPSVFDDTSTRAVVTAPLQVITAPIDGEVAQSPFRPGDTFRAGDTVAAVANSSVDRSALLQLETQALALAQEGSETQAERASLVGQLRFNTSDLAAQRRELQGQNREERRALAAALSSAEARLAENAALLERQETMLRSGHVAAGYVDPTRYKVSAARADVAAARANLDGQTAQNRAVDAGVYGGGANILNGLHASRQEAALGARRLQMQQRDVSARRQAVDGLILAERTRLDRLGSSKVVARQPGLVVEAAPPGRRVIAGAPLISSVSCDEAIVAAIFPEKRARGLIVGTPAAVEIAGEAERRGGRIQKILPRSDDRAAAYAIPFPPTERRELYVLVALEPARATGPARATSPAACPIGGWATVHLDESAGQQRQSFVARAQAMLAGLFGRTPRSQDVRLAQSSR